MTASDGDTPAAVGRTDDSDDAGFDSQAAANADEPPPPRREGRYTWLPVAGAAALAGALVLVSILLNLGNSNVDPSYGKRVDAHGALLCPKTYQQVTTSQPAIWVPARPNQITADTRLTSDRTPTNAVVCAFLGGTHLDPARIDRSTVALTGRHVLSRKAAVRLNKTLRRVGTGTPAKVCNDSLSRTDGDDYLIGFTYATGTLWVSTPGYHCVGAANGSFGTVTNLRATAAAAYAAGN